jgi:hypothetical protein
MRRGRHQRHRLRRLRELYALPEREQLDQQSDRRVLRRRRPVPHFLPHGVSQDENAAAGRPGTRPDGGHQIQLEAETGHVQKPHRLSLETVQATGNKGRLPRLRCDGRPRTAWFRGVFFLLRILDENHDSFR